MTLVHPDAARQAAPPADDAELTQCEQCGAAMAADQEWCIECGAARTLIHPPPDLRLAAGAAGLVVLAAVVAVVIALASLSNSAGTQAAAELARTVTVTVPAEASSSTGNAATGSANAVSTGAKTSGRGTPTGPGAPAVAGFPGWPIGLPGWTVVLASTASEAAARQFAVQFQSRSLAVGILDSDQHPQMTPGHWIVFLNRYPTFEAAHEGSLSLHARGFDTARPARVESAGG